jgi:hypothetical protein
MPQCRSLRRFEQVRQLADDVSGSAMASCTDRKLSNRLRARMQPHETMRSFDQQLAQIHQVLGELTGHHSRGLGDKRPGLGADQPHTPKQLQAVRTSGVRGQASRPNSTLSDDGDVRDRTSGGRRCPSGPGSSSTAMVTTAPISRHASSAAAGSRAYQLPSVSAGASRVLSARVHELRADVLKRSELAARAASLKQVLPQGEIVA